MMFTGKASGISHRAGNVVLDVVFPILNLIERKSFERSRDERRDDGDFEAPRDDFGWEVGTRRKDDRVGRAGSAAQQQLSIGVSGARVEEVDARAADVTLGGRAQPGKSGVGPRCGTAIRARGGLPVALRASRARVCAGK